jgi:hypothetical protein
VRLKAGGKLALVNARDSNHPAVRDVKSHGYNLDDGMVAIIDRQYYHGEKALHILALMSSRSGFFNKMNYAVFSSQELSSLFYPLFRLFRNFALKIKNVQKINS